MDDSSGVFPLAMKGGAERIETPAPLAAGLSPERFTLAVLGSVQAGSLRSSRLVRAAADRLSLR